MAQHSEYKRFLKLNKGFSNQGIEPTTEHSGERLKQKGIRPKHNEARAEET